MAKLYYSRSKRRLPKYAQTMLYIDRKIAHMQRNGTPAGTYPGTGAAATQEAIEAEKKRLARTRAPR